MKAIFLDVDGVLNTDMTQELTSDGWCFVEDELVKNLAKIVKETGAIIILSSSWRDEWNKEDESKNTPSFIELKAKLKEFGLDIYDKTGEWRKNRGLEIQEWLDEHPEVTEFVIIDDWPDLGHLSDFAVMTNPLTGLDEEKSNECIDFLIR